MKTFVDPDELFLIEIPNDWYQKIDRHAVIKNSQPYTFEPYEDQELAFQISIKSKPEKLPAGSKIESAGKNNIEFIETEIPGLNLPNMISWYCFVDSKLVIITLIHNPKLDKKRLQAEIEKAENSKKTFLLLDDATKDTYLPKLRWNNLLLSYAASIDLSNRAFKNGSSLELVVLLGNQIDSILRQSIILKRQLKEENIAIDVKLIHQKETDKPIFEKEAYRMALDLKVIDKGTYQLLLDLYGIRNKAVHRFIISELRSDDIIQLVWSYAQLINKLGAILRSLEKEQFDNKIGLFSGDTPPNSPIDSAMFEELISSIRDKHGNRRLNEDITIGK